MEQEIGALEISGSGLASQRRRMDVVAENLANGETTRTADGGPYRRKLVIFGAESPAGFASTLESAQLSTVRVQGVVESPEPFRLVHNPWHPDANAAGYVAFPNVNPMIEMMDLLSATRAYEANLTVIQATKSMAAKALEIGR